MKAGKVVTMILSLSLRMLLFAVIVYGVVKVGETAYEFGRSVFLEEAVSEEPGRNITVMVEDNTSTMDIAKMLEKKGLIRDYKLFYVQVKVSKYNNKLKPGTYTLNTSMKAEEMMNVMSTEQTEDDLGGQETETGE